MQCDVSTRGSIILEHHSWVHSTLARAGVVSPAASLKASDYADESVCQLIVSATGMFRAAKHEDGDGR